MPPKIAVVGSGPAAFYTILQVLKKQTVAVDFFEKELVPYGLSRFGVSPDHPEVKVCQERFEDVANTKNVRFFGNVHVGTKVPVKTLLDRYNVVLFAYGAESNRHLSIKGENHKAVVPAKSFVGWYNGEPSSQNFDFDLSNAEDVTIVGNGNVALDVARILLVPPDHLKHTDITESALAALHKSKVRHVRIVGRRGVLQSAFTNKELRELINAPELAMKPATHWVESGRKLSTKLSRTDKRKLDILEKGSPVSLSSCSKSWELDFMRMPLEFRAKDTTSLDSVDWALTEFLDENKDRVAPTDEVESTPAQLAFTSIGYFGKPLSGMEEAGIPFNKHRGVIENCRGHVGNTNVFAAGWIKTGPVGVIASTMMDSFAVGEEILSFLSEKEQKSLPGINGVDIGRYISWQDWKRIDKEEIRRGQIKGKAREKFLFVNDMLGFLDST